ncbi:hypothetical protein ES704_03551 [subsurface metagenome]
MVCICLINRFLSAISSGVIVGLTVGSVFDIFLMVGLTFSEGFLIVGSPVILKGYSSALKGITIALSLPSSINNTA